jgi:pectate lyase
MIRSNWSSGFAAVMLCAMSQHGHAVPSFPGAEGWGAITPGGRGGQVIRVTNLNDSGPGSFRAAVEASGPRTVVFDVAGTIQLQSEVSITNPFLTIAGQTAPGGGITIAGETVSLDTNDIIVRYMRFRRGFDRNDPNPRRDDALGSDVTPGNIMIDHVSASWGLDENMSIYRWKNEAGNVLPTHNVTIQWSISSEALNEFNHAFGATWGGKGVNYHHNLFASNTGRNPSISWSHMIDFRNNVLFNWQHRTIDGAGPEAHVNLINNYFQPGPATNSGDLQHRIVKPEVRRQTGEAQSTAGPGKAGWWYVDGNHVVGNPTVTADNWNGGVQWDTDVAPYPGPGPGAGDGMAQHPEWSRSEEPMLSLSIPFDPRDPHDQDVPQLPTISTQSALAAYHLVLAGAGASLARDAVDLRVIQSVSSGIATAGPSGNGIINHPDDVGGYPEIPWVERPADWDTDGDGMPDHWERAHGLDPNDPADGHGDFANDGYTNFEHYLNEIGAFPAPEAIVWNGTLNNRYAQIQNWHISFQPSRFDTVFIDQGDVTLDAAGQHASWLAIGTRPGASATLDIDDGWLHVREAVAFGGIDVEAATLRLSGGKLSTPLLADGAGGTFEFTGGELNADMIDFDLQVDGGRLAPGNSIHTLAPGQSIGETHIRGDLSINSGVLEIEIGGTQPGDYDRVVVDGVANLGGTLEVKLVDLGAGPYEPQLGDLFGVLTSAGGDWMFDGFDLPDLASGLQWALAPGDATLFLAVVPSLLSGDFNGDGVVDASDYTAWRDRRGNMQEFHDWKDNFGTSLHGAGAFIRAATIPEPGAIVMAWLSAVAIALVRRRLATRSAIRTQQ